jgi:hypothetical protein
MGIEDFSPVAAIEALNAGVLIGLAGLDVVNRHAVLGAPIHEALGEEFGPLSTRQPEPRSRRRPANLTRVGRQRRTRAARDAMGWAREAEAETINGTARKRKRP